MASRLFVLFAVVPIVELALLIKVGTAIGTWSTVFLVLATAAVGAYMVRLEGLTVLYRLQANMAQGIFPGDELIDGAMILVAGALLLTPGFVTDVVGFLFVFPASRQLIRRRLKEYLKYRIDVRDFTDRGPYP